jgi:hypothetical protein
MALEDRDELWMDFEESLRTLAAEAEEAEQPAALEHLGATLSPSLAVMTAPEVVSDLVGMLEEIEARALLRALAAAAPPRVAHEASEAIARLGEAPGSAAVEGVGTLVPERAWRLDNGEPVTSVLVECRRPGFPGSELFGFTIEHEETGGALKDGFMTGQQPEGGIEDRVAALPVEAEPLPAEVAVEELAAAARHGVEIDVGPLPDAVGPLTVLLRAVGVSDANAIVEPLPVLSLLTPFVDPAEELDELDEDEQRAEIDALLEELEAWQGQGDERARELALYIAGAMYDYRAGYADGDLAGWSEWELEEFLLDYVPRKVGLEDEDIDAVPATVCHVLRFLAESGRLETRAAARLGARALRLQRKFCEAARDPERFGLAKAMSAAMEADGVDLFDQDAIQGWIDEFNSLTVAEREDRVPALAAPQAPPGPEPAPKKRRSTAAKAKKRQRQARRRNRR